MADATFARSTRVAASGWSGNAVMRDAPRAIAGDTIAVVSGSITAAAQTSPSVVIVDIALVQVSVRVPVLGGQASPLPARRKTADGTTVQWTRAVVSGWCGNAAMRDAPRALLGDTIAVASG